jgi:two-component system sensor histidine kinase/response regulator
MSTELAGSSIDREVALSRVGGDAELLREIAALFLDDYPKVMADLHDAAARGDASTVERTAHSLKGSVANFGAKSVMETALQIEDLGRKKQLAGIAPLLQVLERELAAIHPELAAL